jgi:hypothetical protein
MIVVGKPEQLKKGTKGIKRKKNNRKNKIKKNKRRNE